ncbi:MAG: hypothetical protein CMA88_03695 [Euryarchaeota archaeon]|nr:hypothetical protein [Euryarchaeota archaeon]
MNRGLVNTRVAQLVCLFLVFSVISLPGNSMAQDDDIIIESNLTWAHDMDLSKNVRVLNGGSLTFAGADFSITDGVEIFVDSSSSISIHSSVLESNSSDEGGQVSGTAFSMVVEGVLEATNSSIHRGVISASGTLYINDTSLERVGPVNLESDEAVISLGGLTSFSNSSSGADIRAMAFSEIIWGEGVSGSGGSTNKWERVLAGQSLVFDAVFVTFEITGMYQKEFYTNFSNQDGVSFVDGGRERVVEIAWSDDSESEQDPIWTEQALVTITEYRTAWNPVASGIGNYGGGQFELDWSSAMFLDSGTPEIGWVSITPIGEDGDQISEASVGDSVNMEAVISNSGTAAASLAINCDVASTGEAAQISPSFPNTLVGPGEQSTISFSWRSSSSGDESLSCRILTPTQLVEESAFGGGQMSTGVLSWVEVSDGSGGVTLLPAMIALLVGAGIGGYFLFSIYQEQDSQD